MFSESGLDGMLVGQVTLLHACEEVDELAAENGAQGPIDELAAFEPTLASYIDAHCEAIAGRLALTGAPSPVVQGIYRSILLMTVSAVQAMRRGQYDYWCGFDDSEGSDSSGS